MTALLETKVQGFTKRLDGFSTVLNDLYGYLRACRLFLESSVLLVRVVLWIGKSHEIEK